MGLLNLESTNPTLTAAREFDGAIDTAATVQGVVDKTILLCGVAGAAGVVAYATLPATWNILLVSCLASAIFGIGIAWYLAGRPGQAATWAPVYAIVEGVFLGMITKVLDLVIAQNGYTGGSLALPALIITMSCVLSMLVLYRTKVIRPTETFRSVVFTLTAAVFLAYLAMFVLQLAGVSAFPLLSLGSAFAGGKAAMIGIGLNAAILLLASLWLVIDFAAIEEIVESGKPAALEWYGAFMLLVTLAWIYYEAVKLAFRIAAASRD